MDSDVDTNPCPGDVYIDSEPDMMIKMMMMMIMFTYVASPTHHCHRRHHLKRRLEMTPTTDKVRIIKTITIIINI